MVKTFHKPLYYRINSLKQLFKVLKKKITCVLELQVTEIVLQDRKKPGLGKLGEKFLVQVKLQQTKTKTLNYLPELLKKTVKHPTRLQGDTLNQHVRW
jgi:hypothetical protein